MSRSITLITALIIAAFGVACEPDTPSEKDVGNEVEDACEELKEETGAKDTDC